MRSVTVRSLAGIILAIGLLWSSPPNGEAARKVVKVCKAATLKPASGTSLARVRVHRGDKVKLVQRRGSRSYVLARRGQGWMPTSSLCRHRRHHR